MLSPEYLALKTVEALSGSTKIYFGPSIPATFVDLSSLTNGFHNMPVRGGQQNATAASSAAAATVAVNDCFGGAGGGGDTYSCPSLGSNRV